MAETSVSEIPDYPCGLTFEQVWAALMENREQLKETDRIIKETAASQKETAREMEETDRRMKETDREMKETARMQKETDRLFKAADRRLKLMEKNLGGLGNSLGQLIETLIAARLWEKFAAYPYSFRRAFQRVRIYNENNQALSEIDILLIDTEWAMAVEVKREAASIEGIKHLIEQMGIIRQYPPAEAKGKKLLGAIAGGIVKPHISKYAHKAGFFVLELQGESVALVPPPEGFAPREW